MLLKFDFDLNEALKRENVSRDVLRNLRETPAEGMPNVITDHQLLLFYVACDKHFEDTQKAIRKFYKYKRNVPTFFSHRNPASSEVQQCLNNQIYCFLPVTPKNFSVIYARLSNSNPLNFIFDNTIKTYFMTIDSCLSAHGPRSGIIFLFDAKNVTLGHIKQVTLKSIKTFCNFVHQGLPAKLEEIHIINAMWYFENIMMLVRPFLKPDRKILIHGPSADYSKIFEGKIPLECLPSDLGGKLESIEVIHEQHSERLLKMKNFFEEEEKQWN